LSVKKIEIKILKLCVDKCEMTNYQAFEETAEERMEDIEEGTVIEHSRCIICLSDAHYENGNVETGKVEKSTSPLMDIRVLCGKRSREDGVCNCRYNIHTSCFINSNEVYHNKCPMCRRNWWRKEGNELCNTNTEYSENEGCVDKLFTCCVPGFVLVLFIVFLFGIGLSGD